ncbi:ATP-binding cassette, regulator of translational elongation [Pestalotiopsis sp. IQ-011]
MDLGYHDGNPARVNRTGVMFLLQEFLGHPNDSSPAYRFWLSWFDDEDGPRWKPDAPDWTSPKTDAYASFAIARFGLFETLQEFWQIAQHGSPPDQERQRMHLNTTVRSCRGWGLLEIASYFGHASIVKSLSAAGIDNIDASNPRNYPMPGAFSLQSLPLSITARQGHLEVCKTLIQDTGSDPNFPTGSLNPLYVALEKNNMDCVHFLVNSGVDLQIPAQTLLQQARVERNGRLPLTIEPEEEKAALLQEASTNGDLAAVEQLLRENADVNWKPTNDRIDDHFGIVMQRYLLISKRLIHALEAVDTEWGVAAT